MLWPRRNIPILAKDDVFEKYLHFQIIENATDKDHSKLCGGGGLIICKINTNNTQDGASVESQEATLFNEKYAGE